ncbi:MAG: helix-turn-helix transcriptional regulator [Lachnospiraceae bacterium]|nr:helix-turn-helix transcriptional regulator [Lachnospiraceae bacterium]MBR6350422.1 helix-turn-helix transcriptional regulator [Lachnospiraceae bacterium]
MKNYIWETEEEIDLALAKRLQEIRKRRSLSQQQLAAMSGVSFGSVKRFETSGEISLKSLTRIAMSLGCTDEIKGLFQEIPYRSINEVVKEANAAKKAKIKEQGDYDGR